MVMIQKQCLQAGREHLICQTPAITISNLFQFDVSNMEDPVQLKDEGNTYFQAHDYENAIQSYTNALKLSKDKKLLGILYRNRAACYLKKENYAQAASDASRAIDIDASDIKALYRRCQALEKVGKLDQAFKDVQRCATIEPKNQTFLETLRRLGSEIQEKLKVQFSTDSRVKQMFEILLGEETDKEKREKAANNLIVLAREDAGAERIFQNNGINLLMELIKTKNPEMILAAIRTFSGMCTGHKARATAILHLIGIEKICSIMAIDHEEIALATCNLFQTICDSLSGEDKKEHGNEEALVLGLKKILKVAGQLVDLPDHLPMTENTQLIASILLNKLYDDLRCDPERDNFRVTCEEYVTGKFDPNNMEKNLHAIQTVSGLLQGPFDVGNKIAGLTGVMEMMVALCGSDREIDQLVAVEALIHASTKMSKATFIITNGVSLLKDIYKKTKNEKIKIRALVGLCKLGSAGGDDYALRQFAEGSTEKLAKQCRKPDFYPPSYEQSVGRNPEYLVECVVIDEEQRCNIPPPLYTENSSDIQEDVSEEQPPSYKESMLRSNTLCDHYTEESLKPRETQSEWD
ncbi:UNVERIFIED_CONTAM: hypothetical protein FKN15_003170 [Acipenser sinensis]